jgi:hypothetical protein
MLNPSFDQIMILNTASFDVFSPSYHIDDYEVTIHWRYKPESWMMKIESYYDLISSFILFETIPHEIGEEPFHSWRTKTWNLILSCSILCLKHNYMFWPNSNIIFWYIRCMLEMIWPSEEIRNSTIIATY